MRLVTLTDFPPHSLTHHLTFRVFHQKLQTGATDEMHAHIESDSRFFNALNW